MNLHLEERRHFCGSTCQGLGIARWESHRLHTGEVKHFIHVLRVTGPNTMTSLQLLKQLVSLCLCLLQTLLQFRQLQGTHTHTHTHKNHGYNKQTSVFTKVVLSLDLINLMNCYVLIYKYEILCREVHKNGCQYLFQGREGTLLLLLQTFDLLKQTASLQTQSTNLLEHLLILHLMQTTTTRLIKV